MRCRLGHPLHHILVQLGIRVVAQLVVAVPELLGRAASRMLLIHRLVVGALLGLLLRVNLIADGVWPTFDLKFEG